MNKVTYNRAKIACLLSVTILTTSGCMINGQSEAVKEDFQSPYCIESVDEEQKQNSELVLNDNSEPSVVIIESNEAAIKSASFIEDNNQIDNSNHVEEIDPVKIFLSELISTDYGYTSNMQDFYNENWEVIENYSLEDDMNIRTHYSKLAYQKLLEANIPYDAMITELNNLMVEQQLPRCMCEEDWCYNFGNLITTLKEEESLFSTYFTLACDIHKAKCPDEHEFDMGITCKTLKKEFKNKYE